VTARATTPTPHPTPKPVTPKPAPPAPAPQPLLVQQLASVGNAQQVVIVTSSSWSTDVATVQTFEKDAGTWRAVFAPMAAHIGRAGFSADKHEGDLKTPTGMYGFGTMFGQRPNPGVKFPYRQADSQSVWVDDVNSPYYNTWQENAALSGEHLASAGFATAYAYAVDIAYNSSPIVRGKGSAIFFHVSTGGGTAGCVSVSMTSLLEVLRWLDPARSPVIVMGPSAVIRQY
jgi:L,D-peptidoglycan transpeptidase YkuD (ErfK/YbiS/YcfS/YnhG family)